MSLASKPRGCAAEAAHLVVDSTGLKVFGAGEWLEEKHKVKRKRRTWLKLHLGLSLASGEIICSDLTMDDVGDPSALPALFDQIDTAIDRFLADGAYDGEPTAKLARERFGPEVEVIIAPPKNAVLSADAAHNPTSRDRHIAAIAAKGRMAWQTYSGYNHRSGSRHRWAARRP